MSVESAGFVVVVVFFATCVCTNLFVGSQEGRKEGATLFNEEVYPFHSPLGRELFAVDF